MPPIFHIETWDGFFHIENGRRFFLLCVFFLAKRCFWKPFLGEGNIPFFVFGVRSFVWWKQIGSKLKWTHFNQVSTWVILKSSWWKVKGRLQKTLDYRKLETSSPLNFTGKLPFIWDLFAQPTKTKHQPTSPRSHRVEIVQASARFWESQVSWMVKVKVIWFEI